MHARWSFDINFYFSFLDKKINCNGTTELLGDGAKLLSEDGLTCMVREGATVRKYDHGIETIVREFWDCEHGPV